MKRRDFLQLLGLAGASIIPVAGFTPVESTAVIAPELPETVTPELYCDLGEIMTVRAFSMEQQYHDVNYGYPLYPMLMISGSSKLTLEGFVKRPGFAKIHELFQRRLTEFKLKTMVQKQPVTRSFHGTLSQVEISSIATSNPGQQYCKIELKIVAHGSES